MNKRREVKLSKHTYVLVEPNPNQNNFLINYSNTVNSAYNGSAYRELSVIRN